jgi:hypothetical protein
VNKSLFPELQHHDFGIVIIWFQQGATAHPAWQSINKLINMSEQGIAIRYSDISRPGRSPSLSACDFFSWGYLKSRVFQTRPTE